MRKIECKPWHGIVFFIIQMILFIFVCAPLQYAFGMIGLAVTELIILAIAIILALLTKQSLKEVFPVKKVSIRQLMAVVIFWFSGFIINMAVTMFLQIFVQEQVVETGQALSSMFQTVPFLASFFIVAVMPAVCEEAMHRGLIQYTMHSIKSKWVLIALMGVIFGIFHLDPVRFAGTMVLGVILSYLMYESGNLILPVLMHLLNNAVSVIASSSVGDLHESAAEMTLSTADLMASAGVLLILCTAAPFLMLAGSKLLHTASYNAERKGQGKKSLVTAFIVAICLLISGLITTILAPSF